MKTMAVVRPIYSREQIDKRIIELGNEISRDFGDLDHPVMIGVMKGAFCFMADLIRQIDIPKPIQIEFIRLSSYGNATETSGQVQTPYLDLPDLKQRNILIVEDIVDSGNTARFLLDYLKEKYNPNVLKLATFLSKPSRRTVDVKLDYLGFEVPDLFVVGYGLDYDEKYRELPYLAELSDN
jgi:hypoxanthine phosphoribosyltransferase